MTYKHSRIWLTAAMLSILTACGGGGGGSDSSSNDGSTGSGSSGVSVNGGASKGPLNGATIKVYEITSLGFIDGTELPITATTAADGTFTLTFPVEHENDHPHLLQAVGGFYMDESDQNGIRKVDFSAGPDVSLEAILPASETTVAITPYSNALYIKSHDEANSNSTSFIEVFAQNRMLAEDAYGFDIVATLPDDPVNPVSSDNDRKLYGQLLGGAANAINNIAIAVGLPQADIETIGVFTQDLSDGTLDGYKYSTPLTANSTSIPNVDLTSEIERFRNNNQSAYGSLLADVDSDLLSKSAVAEWDEFNWDEALWQATPE